VTNQHSAYDHWKDAGVRRSGDENNQRKLTDDAGPAVQKIIFNNCLFKHNAPGIKSELTHYGVIFAETPGIHLVVNNSIFLDNAFHGSKVVVSTPSLLSQTKFFASSLLTPSSLIVILDDRAIALPSMLSRVLQLKSPTHASWATILLDVVPSWWMSPRPLRKVGTMVHSMPSWTVSLSMLVTRRVWSIAAPPAWPKNTLHSCNNPPPPKRSNPPRSPRRQLHQPMPSNRLEKSQTVLICRLTRAGLFC
jgi:hypothetical protein